MQTIITKNSAIMTVLGSLHEPEHQWLVDTDAQFKVVHTFEADYSCIGSRNEYSVNSRGWKYEITFEDDNVALQFKLTYGDLL
jgi:hypothetical protein